MDGGADRRQRARALGQRGDGRERWESLIDGGDRDAPARHGREVGIDGRLGHISQITRYRAVILPQRVSPL